MNRHTPERSGWSELGGITNYKWQKQFEEQWGILHNRYGKRDLLREWPETTAGDNGKSDESIEEKGRKTE